MLAKNIWHYLLTIFIEIQNSEITLLLPLAVHPLSSYDLFKLHHGPRAALTGALIAVHADCAAGLSGGRTREPMATAGGAETHGSGPAGLSRGAGAAEAHEGLEAGRGPARRGSGGVPGKTGHAGPRAVRGGPESCRGPPAPLLPIL